MSDVNVQTILDEHAMLDEQTQRRQYLGNLKKRLLFDVTIDYPEEVELLSIGDNGLLPVEDLTMIAGKSKAGKSYVVSILVASVLGCTDFGFTPTQPDAKVLYFDTEQSDRNIGRIQRRIYKMLGWKMKTPYPQFQIYPILGEEVKIRFEDIADLVELEKPQLVVIDNIADLVYNPNDLGESNEAINQLLFLCHSNHIALLSVLHENKGKEDKNMKGHLGTMALQKCADLFSVNIDGKSRVVSNEASRNKPVDNWAFVIDDKGLPQSIEAMQLSKEADKQENKKKERAFEFANIFASPNDRYKFSELCSKFMKVVGGSEATAKRHILEAKEMGVINLSGGIYTLS